MPSTATPRTASSEEIRSAAETGPDARLREDGAGDRVATGQRSRTPNGLPAPLMASPMLTTAPDPTRRGPDLCCDTDIGPYPHRGLSGSSGSLGRLFLLGHNIVVDASG